jgi:phosphoribosylformylglycinamidine (FGAM) synthase-like enzyme
MSSGSSNMNNFASVQRSSRNATSCTEVIDACWAVGDKAIISIHDVGAGGLSALPELVHDSDHGGNFHCVI